MRRATPRPREAPLRASRATRRSSCGSVLFLDALREINRSRHALMRGPQKQHREVFLTYLHACEYVKLAGNFASPFRSGIFRTAAERELTSCYSSCYAPAKRIYAAPYLAGYLETLLPQRKTCYELRCNAPQWRNIAR